ncbi:hypothetical protein CC1G_07068 [Coprinopsis cinerea okayama7|uniref:Uncharacterized protein n=1 Tax=Coprinopsis cinerea (strain Okayama-7 / 130 / ATCC MYA-4618 / FGSC 9003) TaxID=240176 RepID=A8NUC1_COPC7|nr:hypothetical protein CC1G_07068 [Coprinopsis cinerea okayama7\|eukprot:XP_001836421.2 hypothetical protein CC1G_07068 [Coprinopsis cinerea okayama7\
MSLKLLSRQSGEARSLPSVISAKDIFAIVPLHHAPVAQRRYSSTQRESPIGLVDPLDMIPRIYELRTGGAFENLDQFSRDVFSWLQDFLPQPGTSNSLGEIVDPLYLWDKFAAIFKLDKPIKESIAKELTSSFHYQYLAYINPPKCPSLKSPPIQWEQSLVAGHPTHPGHMRMSLITNDTFSCQPMNSNFRTSFGCSLMRSFFLPMFISRRRLKQASGTLLSYHIKRFALTLSHRTVIVPELPGYALKLSIGVKISSALRTISHFTADFGPRFSTEVVPKLRIDHTIFAIETEPSSGIYRCEDPEIRKHFTAVIREEYKAAPYENVILIAALLETDHANLPPGVPAVTHVFGLNTERKRIQFLDRYIELSCKALLPALVYNGVAFEAHAQNLLLRVDRRTGKITGFVLRDLGGLRIHPPTLRRSLGIDFDFLPKHAIATESLQEVYPKFYHTYVHNHLQRLIRLLGLHHNGIGWELLREHMNAVIPIDHELRDLWLSPKSHTVESKCLMRMRLQDSYREGIASLRALDRIYD